MATSIHPLNEIIVSLAIELPYWISIKSGDYSLQNGRTIRMRNDLWMISTGNIIDGPVESPSDFIVNEEQVTDKVTLENRTRGQARYFHKRKMNTTFTRSHQETPPEVLLSATYPTDEWIGQLQNVVFGALQNQSKLDEFLQDANLFINLYSTIISVSPQNSSRVVREVSFYETMIHLRIYLRTEHFHFEILTRMAPDYKMAGQPYPPSRVKDHRNLGAFRDAIHSCPPPEFHQLEWNKTLNYERETRYQEALLHATITLESLAYIYLSAKGYSKMKQRCTIEAAGGLAKWLLSLNVEELKDEPKNLAELMRLRNDVVHRGKMLTDKDIELVKSGIQSLSLVRAYLLQTGKPAVLELESEFASFLEPVELGKATSDSIGRMVQMRFGWRKEKDCYRVITEPEAPSD